MTRDTSPTRVFQHDLVAFAVPLSWRDDSIVRLVAPAGQGRHRGNLVLSRQRLRPGDTLAAQAERSARELAALCPSLMVEHDPSLAQPGWPAAHATTLRWQLPDGLQLVQRQVALGLGATAQLLILTCPASELARHEPVLARAVASFGYADVAARG